MGKFKSNEERLKFSPTAHISTLDISNISFHDAVTEGITTGIANVFKHVAKHELKKYRTTHGPSSADKKQLQLSDMPGVGKKLVFADVSSSLIPTTMAREDGIIFVNNIFVRVMCLLKRLELDGTKGDIFGCEEDLDHAPPNSDKNRNEKNEPYMGNLYKAILYSIAIHEIQGHFKIIKDRLVFDNDAVSQPQRGNSMLYFNLAALLWFFLEVVEDKNGFDVTRLKSFFKTNNVMFKKFIEDVTDEMKQLRLSDLFILYRKLSKTVKDNGIVLHKIGRKPVSGKSPAEPQNCSTVDGIPYTLPDIKKPPPNITDTKPTPASVFTTIIKTQTKLTTTSLSRKFSGTNQEIVQPIVTFLNKLCLVKDVNMPGGGPITHLKTPPMTITEQKLVLEILDTLNDVTDLKTKIAAIRIVLVNTLEPTWKKMFIHMIEKAIEQKDAVVRGKNIVIAVETSWIPEPRKKNVKKLLDSLKESGNCKIVYGSSHVMGKNLIKALVSKTVSPGNLIILAGEPVLKQEEFITVRTKFVDKKKSPFLVGVRNSDLKNNSYIRLMAMLTCAVQLAYNLDKPPMSAGISRSKVVKNLCVFKPLNAPVSDKELDFFLPVPGA